MTKARIKAAFHCLVGHPTIYGVHGSRIDLAPTAFEREVSLLCRGRLRGGDAA
jgi:hypothetical protein